ncbi:MAG TPA: FapA family protein [Patescibacteria group bacterium]|nr:FapA family protein [Patescibacteria group bacterium]
MTDSTDELIKQAQRLLANSPTEPNIAIFITRDRMEAMIQINLPEGCRIPELSELYLKMEQSGIRHGIDAAAVKQAQARPGLKFPCAKGTLPSGGQDASIHYLVSQETRGCPIELENGRVDFKNLNLFTIVHKGDRLAIKTPATPGTDGTDVLGLPIAARAGKDIPLRAGKNVILSDDGLTAIANSDGQIILDRNQLHVLPCLQIDGDVDFSTGNIDFTGSVVVNGSVTAGFTVKATGTVDIRGMVTGGTIHAQKIIVRHGIQGMHKGEIRAQGDIIAQFIENATIFAGGNVLAHSVILHSQVEAHQSIELASAQSQIIGGCLNAAQDIITYSAGRPRAALTELRAGVNPTLEAEEEKLSWALAENKHQLEQLRKPLAMFNNAPTHSLSEERKQAKRELEAEHKKMAAEVATAQAQLHNMGQELKTLRQHGKILVHGPIYPGVTVTIGKILMPVTEMQQKVEFRLHDDILLASPLLATSINSCQ